jgi:nucleotide-binding universal stress UspA family protein
VAASVVCGVDHSIPSRAAARLAVALAGRLGLELVFVHALEAADQRAAARSRLRALRLELEVPDAHLHVDVGRPAELLAEAAGEADLLVIGGAGGDPSRVGLGGGVRASLARGAPCPLAVVPATPRLGGAAVICGVRDWADVAAAAVATRLARALGLPLTLVHVLPNAVGRGATPSRPSPFDLDRPWDYDAAQRLLEVVAETVGATASLRVERGHAGRLLAREAAIADAGLLVVGAPSHGRLGAALAGSATAHLMRRCLRPVVVCRCDSLVAPRHGGG